MTPVDQFWSLTCFTLVLSLTNGTPINRQVGISENVFITVQNDTYGNEHRVCSIDSMTYGDGETIPTSSPCEHCVCRPPGFACTIISCEYRPGCKAFKRSNQCCPEYQCECEKDGRIYQNGEKIMDSNNPCEVCYCQGGEIVCAVLDCYWRSDCQPRYIESRCCPLYDHCPPASNVGPFMSRPTTTSTTSMPPSFPWFDLSSAVYEVPHRTTSPPTPVPVILTSSAAPSTSSTPQPLPEIVVATEKIPIEVNIMATSQNQGDEEQASVPEVNVVSPSIISTSPPPSADVENSETVVSEQNEIVPSTPVLPSPVSTTIFAAPVIAISIVPSPVEHILVTQEVALPEIAQHVEQTSISSIVEEIAPTQNIGLEGDNAVAPLETVTEYEHLYVPTTVSPQVESEENTTKQSLSFESEAVGDDTVEVTTEKAVADESYQEADIAPVSTGNQISEDFTTVPPSIDEISPSIAPPTSVQIPSVVMSPPDRESIVPDVEVVTITPAPGISVPSIEIQPPNLDSEPAIVNDDQILDSTTLPSVIFSDEKVNDDAITILAHSQDIPIENIDLTSELSSNDDIQTNTADEPSFTTTPTAIVQDNSEATELPIFDQAQNTETEVVTEVFPELTTEAGQPQRVSDTQSVVTSPSELFQNFDNDQPQSDQGITDEIATVTTTATTHEQEESVSTTSTTTTSSPDDSIQINNDDINTGYLPKDSDTAPFANAHPSVNEVNSIIPDNFEIIPPQSDNDIEVPEIQNQIMEKPHVSLDDKLPINNEVVPQNDRNADDDTIEIFAAQNVNVDESSVVKSEITTTPVAIKHPELVAQQDDAIAIMPEEDNGSVAHSNDDDVDHEEIMHPDDQHGSSDDIVSTTQVPSEQEVANDDKITNAPSVLGAEESLDISRDEESRPSITNVNHVQSPVHDVNDILTTTTSTDGVQNDGSEPDAVVTTPTPHMEPESKFRLDLSVFDGGSSEVQFTGAAEVVFDESQQLPAHTTPQAIESNIKQQDEIKDDAELEVVPTTFTSVEKLSRDDHIDPTTLRYRGEDIPLIKEKAEVESIKNFEFDEVPAPPATTIFERSDDIEATTLGPQNNNSVNMLRNYEVEQTTVPGIFNDFVHVSTDSPSGFASEYREELELDKGIITTETPVFDDEVKLGDDVEVVTKNSPVHDKAKSELVDDLVTTIQPQTIFNDNSSIDDDEIVSTTLTPVLINDTSSQKTVKIISLDTMMIPKTGIALSPVSDDINARSKSDIGSEIEDSWLLQTAFKNRQMHGLFPSSRSQKRLFRPRSPRVISYEPQPKNDAKTSLTPSTEAMFEASNNKIFNFPSPSFVI